MYNMGLNKRDVFTNNGTEVGLVGVRHLQHGPEPQQMQRSFLEGY